MKNVSPAFAALAVTALLTACGGGGSATAPGATPSTAILSFTCWNSVVLLGPVQPTKVGCAAVTDSAIKATVTGSTLTFAGIPTGAALTGSTLVAQNGNSSITFTNGTITSGTIMFSTTYTFTGAKLTFSNAPDLTIAGSFTTGANPVTAWWPPTFIPEGVKNFLDKTLATPGAVVNATYPGQTQSGLLPPLCRITGDDCWKEAVRNGTIKFAATTAVNKLQPTRPVAFGFYKTVDTIFFPGQNTMMYCLKPFFADDGTLVNAAEKVESGCNTWEAIYQVSNSLGEILQQKNPTTGALACYQTKFVLNQDKISGGWTNTEVPCP